MAQFIEGLFVKPAPPPSTSHTVIATRAFLRGGLTAIQRIDTQLVDASLSHAGGDLTQAEDHLNAALFLATQLQVLLTQARQALDSEKAAHAARKVA